MVQILGGLITYILLAIYCHNEFGEKVSILRVRELRIKIINETRATGKNGQYCGDGDKREKPNPLYANT